MLTANYMGGNVTVFPLGSRGELLEGDTLAFTGSGPDKERQSQPHLHCVLFTPDSRLLLANDLGTDCIHVFPVSEKKGEGLLDRTASYDVKLAGLRTTTYMLCAGRETCLPHYGTFG